MSRLSGSDHIFDRDLALKRLAPNRLQGRVSPRWSVFGVPDGGYLMALGAAAVSTVLTHRDPVTVTAHFLQKTEEDLVDIKVERLRAGRSLSNGAARIVQRGEERVRLLAAFADLETLAGPTSVEEAMPPVPSPRRCEPGAPVTGIELARRYETRYPPGAYRVGDPGVPDAAYELLLWRRMADGRPEDLFSLMLLADSLPPPIVARRGMVGWTPTLELTVHLRQRPRAGFILCRTRTRYLIGGLMENDGEYWDEDGRLVALSRQIMRYRGD